VIHMWNWNNHMWFTYDSHVNHMWTETHVKTHMWNTCESYVNYMWITCDCSNSACEPHVGFYMCKHYLNYFVTQSQSVLNLSHIKPQVLKT
jgi:hypothetical protein